jgi:tRNA threonylcarbamoyladenosine biosynthesis protein TsaB
MILCIETATSICSVALCNGDKILAFRETSVGYSHAEKLTVFISEVLNEAGVTLKSLDAVAVSSGPGSYTGLRIGVSVAKGLCFAADKPLISISTLEAMTVGALTHINTTNNDSLFCPMIDARRMEIYCALFDSQLKCIQPIVAKIVTPEFYSDISEFREIYFFGDGAQKCRSILHPPFLFLPDVFPSAMQMVGLANIKLKAKEFENLALFEPFYLKEYNAGKIKSEL